MVACSLPRRLGRISRCKINARVKGQKGSNRLIHRDVHPLPRPPTLAAREALRGIPSAAASPDTRSAMEVPTLCGGPSRGPVGVVNASLALDDYIVAGSIFLWPAVAKTGDGAIDQRRHRAFTAW